MSKVSDVLTFKDKGVSVEDARKAMVAAGEAPRGLRIPGAKATAPATAVDLIEEAVQSTEGAELEPEFVDDGRVTDTRNPNAVAQDEELVIQGVKPPAKPAGTPAVPGKPAGTPPAPVKPAVAKTVSPPDEQTHHIETDKFSADIFQAEGGWIAELKYKNGAGTERFKAASKNELMLELLRGKGNATLRVREAVRREKLGGPKLDKYYPLPDGMSAEVFNSLPDETQAQLIDNIAAAQAVIFRDSTLDYYMTAENGKALDKFLKEHDLPYTLNNLKYAHEELTENDLYPDRRGGVIPTPVTPKKVETILAQPEQPEPAAEDSASAVEEPEPASPVPVASAEPKVVVRKRGSTGLPSGSSSVPQTPAVVETREESKELSEAELRALPLDQLKRISDADRRRRAVVRQ